MTLTELNAAHFPTMNIYLVCRCGWNSSRISDMTQWLDGWASHLEVEIRELFEVEKRPEQEIPIWEYRPSGECGHNHGDGIGCSRIIGHRSAGEVTK